MQQAFQTFHASLIDGANSPLRVIIIAPIGCGLQEGLFDNKNALMHKKYLMGL